MLLLLLLLILLPPPIPPLLINCAAPAPASARISSRSSARTSARISTRLPHPPEPNAWPSATRNATNTIQVALSTISLLRRFRRAATLRSDPVLFRALSGAGAFLAGEWEWDDASHGFSHGSGGGGGGSGGGGGRGGGGGGGGAVNGGVMRAANLLGKMTADAFSSPRSGGGPTPLRRSRAFGWVGHGWVARGPVCGYVRVVYAPLARAPRHMPCAGKEGGPRARRLSAPNHTSSGARPGPSFTFRSDGSHERVVEAEGLAAYLSLPVDEFVMYDPRLMKRIGADVFERAPFFARRAKRPLPNAARET